MERMLNKQKFNLSYQPLPFRGFEVYVREKRPWALIDVAHPDFRDELRRAAQGREATVYFRR